MKNKLTRLERICDVLDDTLSRLEPDFDPEKFNFYRYNYWMERLDQELFRNRIINYNELNISPFMEVTICRAIALIEDREMYHKYHGFTREEHHNAIGRNKSNDERVYKRRSMF